MTKEEIEEGKKVGAGHGLYIPPNLIKINAEMPSELIFLNFIHENIHHAFPDLHEKAVDILTAYVGCQFDIGRRIYGKGCDFLEGLNGEKYRKMGWKD